MTLLRHHDMIDKPIAAGFRGWKKTDGIIITAMKKAGYKEYVHNPSLVQHTGAVSSMRNRPHPQATSFRGEDFDALELLCTSEDMRTRLEAAPVVLNGTPTNGWTREDWTKEVTALKLAIAGDEERLRNAGATQERNRLNRYLADYRIKLAEAERHV